MEKNDEIQSKGGRARAKALTPDERSEIAKAAAEARWSLPVAHFEGEISVGDKSIPCAVVEDGKEVYRVITSAGFMRAIGRPWKGSYRDLQRPNFLEARNLQEFVGDDLEELLSVVEYRTASGSVKSGYRAEMIPKVCEVYLSARDDGTLQTSQIRIAKECDIIIRGLAQVGIVALVDEATGYQEIRDRIALQEILNKYLTDEWAKWTKTFPDEFYKQLFRLKGMTYPPKDGRKRPQYVGHWTNDIVYSRLTPGVLKELKKKNPRTASGNRKRKHHQHLTREYGHPELTQHLSNVVFLMKSCASDKEFKERLDIAAPKYGETMSFPFETT